MISPGVDVQIINESFYNANAGTGSVPLIAIATASNKVSPSGIGFAPETAPQRAGILKKVASQRELIQAYGNPKFYSLNGTPLHGHELNEYGLHAAYQFLGISDGAYIIRADIDLAQLEASATAPRSNPIPGTYWLDTSLTTFGLFVSNGGVVPGSAWVSTPVRVAYAADCDETAGVYTPKDSFGSNGNFAIVVVTADNKIYEKIAGSWFAVGSTEWNAERPTTVTGSTNPSAVASAQAFSINGTTITTVSSSNLAAIVTLINDADITNISAAVVSNALVISNTAGGNIVLANVTGTPLATLGLTIGTKKGLTVTRTANAQYPAGSVAGDVWIKGTSANRGADWAVKFFSGSTGSWVRLTAPFFAYDSTLVDGNSSKDTAAFIALGQPSVGNVYVGYDSATGVQEIRRWSGTRWETLVYEASVNAPSSAPVDGTLWYSANLRADIMVSDGNVWQGYGRRYPSTDPAGVAIAGSAPTAQSDGTALVEGDLWINSADLENYPALYRYRIATNKWVAVDKTDQTTPFGVVFADARQDSGQTFLGIPNDGDYAFGSEEIEDMLVSDYVDPDAPDPRGYPDGMMLFNTRYSTYNVKAWRPDYFLDGNFDANTDYTAEPYYVGDEYEFAALVSAGRWVTISGNKEDGSPYMGRKAVRAVVVRAMQAALAANEDARSSVVYYNLLAAPGYPELIDEMVALNVDQKEISFVVGDTPARLAPASSSVLAWATNSNNAASNGEDGLTSANPYCAVYYPWGLSTNIDGASVMVPPSTMALRTIAYSDQVSYPWFAPAGTTRGVVSNATSVGYLTAEGEFRPVLISKGQFDTLYANKVNPIEFVPGRGLVVNGQKTLAPVSSALDRINVARLASYIKFNLDVILRPFLFEQNDANTRDSARILVERFLSGLLGLRALDDFAVLCDESNNTAERRGRNELWIDIAIQPTKSVEFIYVPVRMQNSLQ